ncbi:glycosyltransferase [Azoarcus indigens]|uniref:Glycosyltransferase involved in cell wall biosynthesis n=1 Tax=Azoarcus indigens TaxID=29545 RepID=A0A4R6E7B8_9RHOO|nr:glycosyltransferase family 2 protein [Azoarcus indigens]NMG63895.1 glycosyltransferase [Azoarcus indigens]TDN53830.1 glycosyltransferase involved in cell wall biosynthesis [Azoarcus indigens]
MRLSIVVPCYNEEAVLPETVKRLAELLERLSSQGRIDADSHALLVDDGSKDRTWTLIEECSAQSKWIRGIKLSRNRGHQNALLAGLFHADGDAMVSVDADLQDDLEAIAQMVDAHLAGMDVVYGVRRRRETDTFFKRASAEGYYKLLARMGVEIVFNHADYRLLSRRAVSALREYGESNFFLRGIIPQLGFPSATVYYDRAERFAGESKYPLSKMLAFAWQGITSFSAAPLRMITGLGLLISLGSFAISAWALWVKLFSDHAVPGWASTVVPIYLLGGVQLLCVGIIGEYLAKIYLETKQRPRYFIEKTAGEPQRPQ